MKKLTILLLLLLLYPITAKATYNYDNWNGGIWKDCGAQKVLIHVPNYTKAHYHSLTWNDYLHQKKLRSPSAGMKYTYYQDEKLYAYYDGVNWIECCNKSLFKKHIPVKNTDPVPLPTTLLLLGTGMVGLFTIKKRRKRMDSEQFMM